MSGDLHAQLCAQIDDAIAKATALQDSHDRLLAALRELLEASLIEPNDLPGHKYEAILTDAQSRASAAIRSAER